MEYAAKISLINGLAAVITILCCCSGYLWAIAINVICCVMMMYFCWNTLFLRQVIVTSQFLGAVFAVGFIMACFSRSFISLGLYMMVMAVFHFSEFHVIAVYNPGTLSFTSFVLTWRYCVGMVVSWVEYLLEYMIYPDIKAFSLTFSVVGLMLVVVGELIRKVAMIKAGLNFTHEIARKKTHNHKLVTTGLYNWIRHPSYVGLLYWCLGTQILLCNPICEISLPIILWRFFKKRIYDEEQMLIAFYGQKYIEYKKRVGTGLLGVSGYPIRKD